MTPEEIQHSTCSCVGLTGIRGLLEHVGIGTRGKDVSVAGEVVSPASEYPEAADVAS